MVRYFLRFSYIGTPFSGIQRQQHQRVPTITDAIEHSISVHSWLKPGNAREARLQVSSRTDAGVHALCNAAHIDLLNTDGSDTPFDPRMMVKCLNASLLQQSLPVRILEVRHVSPQFNSRFHALGREYLYRFCVNKQQEVLPEENGIRVPGGLYKKEKELPLFEWKRSLAISSPLDVVTLNKAAKLLEGTHNFAAFTTKKAEEAGKNMIRQIDSIEFSRCSGILEDFDPYRENYDTYNLSVRAPSFLHRQVRKMGGAIMSAARGLITVDDIKYMLDNPDRANWIPRAAVLPPDGLYLRQVHYDENDFDNPRIFERDESKEDEYIVDVNDDDDDVETGEVNNSGNEYEPFTKMVKSNYRIPSSFQKD